jgi:DeoR family suf operon transcriptional repressor
LGTSRHSAAIETYASTAAPSTPLATLPITRREILQVIKRHGEARAETIAEELGITVSGIRQHLTGLEASGLVDHREVKSGPGRPRFLYGLTSQGESLFPRRYGEFVQDVLLFLDGEDPGLVDRLFTRRRAARVDRARARVEGLPFAARLNEIARMLDEDGYLAEVQQLEDGSFLLSEHNCAVLTVALRHPRVCSSEMEFLAALLPDADIERTTHIAGGEPSCGYVIRPR